jgi:hypothetical protein
VKRNALAAGLKVAAGHRREKIVAAKDRPPAAAKGTVLVGAHYAPTVRSTLFLVQAEPENAGKSLKQLLGEAINDLCAKYGKPQPYAGEE